jgi:uncharacterized protein
MILQGEQVFFVPSQCRGQVFVYAPLRRYLAVVASRFIAPLSSSIPTPQQDALVAHLKKRLQVPHLSIPSMAGVTPRSQRLTISLSDACNLRCVYCYAYRQNHHPRTLPPKLLGPLIAAFVYNTTAPALYFDFSGDGEPTKSFGLLKRSIEVIRGCHAERPFISKVLLTTNGYFGPTLRQYLVRHLDAITVSFDGIKSIQDLHRPRADGGSSYETVYETVRFFHQACFAITVRVTVTPFSIEHLGRILEFFQSSFPGIKVRIEPVRASGRALECFPLLSDFSSQLATAVAKSELLATSGLNVYEPYNGEGTSFDRIRCVGCPMLENGNWKVTSDGSILCCDSLSSSNPFFLGACDLRRNTIPEVAGRINELREAYHVDKSALCADCFCKYHCAGGCPLFRPLDPKRYCDEIRREGTKWLQAKAFDGATSRLLTGQIAVEDA